MHFNLESIDFFIYLETLILFLRSVVHQAASTLGTLLQAMTHHYWPATVTVINTPKVLEQNQNSSLKSVTVELGWEWFRLWSNQPITNRQSACSTGGGSRFSVSLA